MKSEINNLLDKLIDALQSGRKLDEIHKNKLITLLVNEAIQGSQEKLELIPMHASEFSLLNAAVELGLGKKKTCRIFG
jgi:hypothetical protein